MKISCFSLRRSLDTISRLAVDEFSSVILSIYLHLILIANNIPNGSVLNNLFNLKETKMKTGETVGVALIYGYNPRFMREFVIPLGLIFTRVWSHYQAMNHLRISSLNISCGPKKSWGICISELFPAISRPFCVFHCFFFPVIFPDKI